ncbi:MAG: pyruvoyl-dependent arginine decarboxylase [Candidatus Woesearchaeota archaeon]|nr:MAG: pyruvoyl-dependent arginine decarboxylase [Candidatus Woesearchaeota archaeon]
MPKDFFITSGVGESNITVHAGSYHLALKDAGIERCNIITYSSILPAISQEVEKPNPEELVHGSVVETIIACSTAKKGKRATAGIIFGWLYDKETNQKYGGIVCEYNGNYTETKAVASLRESLQELYVSGFMDKYNLGDIKLITKSFVPKKRYGTALIALCFMNYVCPVIKE